MEVALEVKVNIEDLKKVIETACIGKEGHAVLKVLLLREGDNLTLQLGRKGSIGAMHMTCSMLLKDYLEKHPECRLM